MIWMWNGSRGVWADLFKLDSITNASGAKTKLYKTGTRYVIKRVYGTGGATVTDHTDSVEINAGASGGSFVGWKRSTGTIRTDTLIFKDSTLVGTLARGDTIIVYVDTSAGNTHAATQAFVLNHSGASLTGGTNTDVAYWTGSNTLGADGNFTWTTGTKQLSLTNAGSLLSGTIYGSAANNGTLTLNGTTQTSTNSGKVVFGQINANNFFNESSGGGSQDWQLYKTGSGGSDLLTLIMDGASGGSFTNKWYSSTASEQVKWEAHRYFGTRGSPSALSGSSENYFVLNIDGWNGSSLVTTAAINVFGDGTASSTSMPSKILINTTPDGSNTSATRLTIRGDGSVLLGSSTDTHGNGTMTVANIYQQGGGSTAYAYPDYVFGKSYRMTPLSRLGPALDSLRHIPGLARKPDGVFDQNHILLVKLEEAYRYIAELETRRAQLDRRLSDMENYFARYFKDHQ
jgi:hypothetical protein